jgi:hypothetical protein
MPEHCFPNWMPPHCDKAWPCRTFISHVWGVALNLPSAELGIPSMFHVIPQTSALVRSFEGLGPPTAREFWKMSVPVRSHSDFTAVPWPFSRFDPFLSSNHLQQPSFGSRLNRSQCDLLRLIKATQAQISQVFTVWWYNCETTQVQKSGPSSYSSWAKTCLQMMGNMGFTNVYILVFEISDSEGRKHQSSLVAMMK